MVVHNSAKKEKSKGNSGADWLSQETTWTGGKAAGLPRSQGTGTTEEAHGKHACPGLGFKATYLWQHFPVASKYQWNPIAHKEGRKLLLMPAAPHSAAWQGQMEISTIHVADLWHSFKNYSLSKHVQAGECSFQLASNDITVFCTPCMLPVCELTHFVCPFASKALLELEVAGISHEIYFIITD